jgi:sugar lactone lactonase YvrE
MKLKMDVNIEDRKRLAEEFKRLPNEERTPDKIAAMRGDQKIDKAGFADGIRADVDGNIWASAGWVGDGYDGVHCFAPDGTRIGQILLPEICSNVCFGGTKRNRLFMTGSTSLYAVYVETQGAHIT